MPSVVWKQINRFPEIYFLQGSPLKPEDLKKASLSTAKGVVILSNFNQNLEGNDFNSNTADADTIVIFKTVRQMNKKVMIITEIISHETIGFLSQKNKDKEESHLAS